MALPGDTLFRARHIAFDSREAQRARALQVLRAGLSQGDYPEMDLVGAAQLHGEWLVHEMIHEGLILKDEDGTLEAAPVGEKPRT